MDTEADPLLDEILDEWRGALGRDLRPYRNHHKMTGYDAQHAQLVEPFRKAGLADFSAGMIRPGQVACLHRSLLQRFPFAGFHWRLTMLFVQYAPRHRLRPLPIFRW